MEADIENFNLEDEEEEPISCTRNKIIIEKKHQFFLAGKALTDGVIHFPTLKRTLANLWYPLGRKLRHGEGFCPIKKTIGTKEVFGWNSSLRAPSRVEMFTSCKWVREESPQGLQSSRNTTRMELDLRTQGNSIDEEDVTMEGRKTNGIQCWKSLQS
ncbi:hypothetical protein J1N35_004857 [Gossypium stocksii]|uniref:DUF4283 domain-containing protein n=1 Tax=Gossypium stocksii TaxID=47602 RepID=A0A9D4AGH8_9ROSI|nr:hypothetical protein J1N35_004857 [Gossypium stocksii]